MKGEVAPLSLTVADVRELDGGGGSGHGHLPAAVPDSIRKTLFAKTAPHFAGSVSYSALNYDSYI